MTQTINGQSEITVFNDYTDDLNPGGFVSHTDSRGLVSTAARSTAGPIAELQRTFPANSSTITESLLYAYNGPGATLGELATGIRKTHAIAAIAVRLAIKLRASGACP